MFISAVQIIFWSSANQNGADLGKIQSFIRKDMINRMYYSEEFAGVVGVIGDIHYLLKNKTCDFGGAWDNLIPGRELI